MNKILQNPVSASPGECPDCGGPKMVSSKRCTHCQGRRLAAGNWKSEQPQEKPLEASMTNLEQAAKLIAASPYQDLLDAGKAGMLAMQFVTALKEQEQVS